MNVFIRIRSERGQDLLEYALLAGLIAAAIVALASTAILSGGVNSMVTNIRDCIDFEASTPCDISLP
jgi:Flp pilus assembly pilin Flp